LGDYPIGKPVSQVFPEGFVGQIFNTVIPKDRQVGYFGLGGYTVGGDLSGRVDG